MTEKRIIKNTPNSSSSKPQASTNPTSVRRVTVRDDSGTKDNSRLESLFKNR